MNDFVVSKGKTYYFDADGNKVTGKQTINNATYFFNKDGVMQTGWKKTDDGTYYLGIMVRQSLAGRPLKKMIIISTIVELWRPEKFR